MSEISGWTSCECEPGFEWLRWRVVMRRRLLRTWLDRDSIYYLRMLSNQST